MSTLGSRGALHLRGRRTKIIYESALALVPHVSWLVINDRIDIALAAGVKAVQVGRRSLSVEEVRRIGPGMQVGESVHDVMQSTADWVIAGHIFDTPSHAGEPSRGLAFLHQICQVSPVPVIAIGGITPRDVRAVREAGAHGVAVIRGIWDAPADAVHEYLGEFDR
ncbi:MAG TPA: thiamine phosphate synthase [Gemmatimonadaceae bacterium]|nr:thiamine phosphate synthase [Gemmatimonadaceae bacterium]